MTSLQTKAHRSVGTISLDVRRFVAKPMVTLLLSRLLVLLSPWLSQLVTLPPHMFVRPPCCFFGLYEIKNYEYRTTSDVRNRVHQNTSTDSKLEAHRRNERLAKNA
jgi:hypothetical protein